MAPCFELCISQAGSHVYQLFGTASDDNVHGVIGEESVGDEVFGKLLDLLIREKEEIM